MSVLYCMYSVVRVFYIACIVVCWCCVSCKNELFIVQTRAKRLIIKPAELVIKADSRKNMAKHNTPVSHRIFVCVMCSPYDVLNVYTHDLHGDIICYVRPCRI